MYISRVAQRLKMRAKTFLPYSLRQRILTVMRGRPRTTSGRIFALMSGHTSRRTARTGHTTNRYWRTNDMGLIILKDTRPISADRVEHLPSDTLHACPECEGTRLKARAPREVWKGGARQQDRWCLACGHCWVTVLPPRFQAELIPLTTTRRG